MFYTLALIVFILTLVGIYLYVNKSISKYGFSNMNVFLLIYSVFYILVPFFSIFFKQYRDKTTLYNIILNSFSDEYIFFNFLICSLIIFLMLIVYHNKSCGRNLEASKDIMDSINSILYRKINVFSDMILLISGLSILLLINSVGGLLKYLALGSATRGANSTATEHLSSGMLPLITLSVIILVCPYLYYYLLQIRKSKIVFIKYIISMILAVIYLIYNQGRAPLLLFLLPFFLVSKFMKKRGMLKIIILFMFIVPVLNALNGFFLYLSYGTYRVVETNILSSFLLEFSYPFTNFANRGELVTTGGFRYGIDYIYWIIALIPSSLLNIIGLSKTSIETVGTVNTNAYSYLTSSETLGGIPVDFLTFNYYEGGYITLILAVLLTAYLLKVLDSNFFLLRNNLAVKIVVVRISVSILNFMTNSDWSVIVRTRTDVIILIIIIFYISITSRRLMLSGKNLSKEKEECA